MGKGSPAGVCEVAEGRGGSGRPAFFHWEMREPPLTALGEDKVCEVQGQKEKCLVFIYGLSQTQGYI